MKSFFFFSTFTYLLSIFSPALCANEEPWSLSERHPVFETKNQTSKKTLESSNILSFYQKYISSFDGSRCPLYPTCSAYAYESYLQHGFFLSLVLTSDRLMHEADKADRLALRYRLGKYRFEDSLEKNTFWWAK